MPVVINGTTGITSPGETVTGNLSNNQSTGGFLTTDGAAQTNFQLNTTTSGSKNWRITNEGNAGRMRFLGSDGTTTVFPMFFQPNGQVTMPTQTMFLASITGTPAATASAIVPFDVVTTNTGSAFNTSTNTFTAPIAANYMFAFGVRVDGFTSGNYFHFRPLKNGSSSTAGGGWYGGDYINYTSNSTFAGAYTTFILALAAGDTIKMRQDTSISAGTYLGYQSWFNGYLLG
jgi:hypothetical protein